MDSEAIKIEVWGYIIDLTALIVVLYLRGMLINKGFPLTLRWAIWYKLLWKVYVCEVVKSGIYGFYLLQRVYFP